MMYFGDANDRSWRDMEITSVKPFTDETNEAIDINSSDLIDNANRGFGNEITKSESYVRLKIC